MTEKPHSTECFAEEGTVVTATVHRLEQTLRLIPSRIIACSGGIDSLLLATIAHRASPGSTVVAHDVTPAVPAGATARVVAEAQKEAWQLELVRSSEFDDENYLSNPRNRCYFCKTQLYDALDGLTTRLGRRPGWTVLSGANCDDLGEYRPGLLAAEAHRVRHPYVEAGLGKAEIRLLASYFGRTYADLPASPCLASRLYTGTRVTPRKLRAVEVGEELLRERTGVSVVRCRIRGDEVIIEAEDPDRARITPDVVEAVFDTMTLIEPTLRSACLDDRPYRPGRALELVETSSAAVGHSTG